MVMPAQAGIQSFLRAQRLILAPMTRTTALSRKEREQNGQRLMKMNMFDHDDNWHNGTPATRSRKPDASGFRVPDERLGHQVRVQARLQAAQKGAAPPFQALQEGRKRQGLPGKHHVNRCILRAAEAPGFSPG